MKHYTYLKVDWLPNINYHEIIEKAAMFSLNQLV